jgi:hypothetical protein
MSGQLHALATLPHKRDPLNAWKSNLGGLQCQYTWYKDKRKYFDLAIYLATSHITW